MIRSLLTYLVLFCSLNAHGQRQQFVYPRAIATAKSWKSFIPKGWKLKDSAFGDLNKDNKQDAIVIVDGDKTALLEKSGEEWEGTPRVMLVLFKTVTGYTLAAQANRAALSDNEGGMMGDPYDGITISAGCFDINFFGGAGQKWVLRYRFRYQDNGFYLIGATNTDLYFSKTTIYDYNLITGNVEITKTDEEEPKTNKKYRKKYPCQRLPKLEVFEPWTITIDEEEGIIF